jgi:maltose alpha-D-glucosyltransferase/alpha-amylase
MKRILAVRRKYRAFGRGTLEIIRPQNRKILSYVREYDGEAILCVANLARTAQAVELDLHRFRGRVPIELTGENAFPPIGDVPYLLTLAGQGFFWMRLAETTEVPTWQVERLPASELPVLVLTDGLHTFAVGAQPASERNVARRALDSLEHAVLPDFLRPRRWFAGPGAAIANIVVGPLGTWRAGRGEWMLAMPTVTLADGSEQQYFLPLGIGWEGRDEDWRHRTAGWALAKVREKAAAGFLIDAFGDREFCLALAEAVDTQQAVPLDSGELRFEHTSAYRKLAATAPESVQYLSGEQSNFSAILGNSLFLKGYRRLRPGIHPEIEMGHYLTEVVGYANVAPLAGSLTYLPASGEPVVLAALFGFVRNQGDGWTWTQNHLERHATTLIEQTATGDADPHALYVAQIETLGRRVGELHAALARPTRDAAFAPEPITPADLRKWARDVRREAVLTLRQLQDALPRLPDPIRAAARRLLEHRADLLERVQRLAQDLRTIRATKTRFHGDLHLGQVMVVRDDFTIIEFEGEPGRPFQERRQKHSALRDVAGMLRSFDYARANAFERATTIRPDAADRLATSFDSWLAMTGTAFMHGYADGVGNASCQPRSHRYVTRLVAFFELERALYELRYELDNRPGWARVPIDGILGILGRDHARRGIALRLSEPPADGQD